MGAANALFTVAGAGPVGALLAIALARHGYRVNLFEGRPDSRETSIYQGKSINIALSDRGWRSLDRIGIPADAKDGAIPMYHRTIHGRDGALSYQPYGKEDNAIWSVSRSRINEYLLTLADSEPNDHDVLRTQAGRCRFRNSDCNIQASGRLGDDCLRGLPVRRRRRAFEGASPRAQSAAIQLQPELHAAVLHRAQYSAEPRRQPSDREKCIAHLAAQGNFMLIALPNPDGSFTCTLFLNFTGEVSFESLDNRASVAEFFQREFADAMDYLEEPVETFMTREPAPLFLVQVYPWSFFGKVGLIGDAAHAIVPFYGQGMNCGFEDCAELNELISKHRHDWKAIFPAYEQRRKPNADAIAELSKRNFVEMSDLSGDASFLLRKKIEAKFHEQHPDLWTPLYSMVTFSPDVPYATALRVGDEQRAIMDRIMQIPDIESVWQEAHVTERLRQLVEANKHGTS